MPVVALTWTGAESNDFDDPRNWVDGFGSPVTVGPARGDSLTFDGSAVRPDCNGAHGFGLYDDQADYARIWLRSTYMRVPAYTGTLTFRAEDGATDYDPDFATPASARNRGVTVGWLIVESGAISQPADATELTVLPDGYLPFPQPTLYLGGGTLNSSSYLSAVHVLGGALIAPVFEETVSVGSHLILTGTESPAALEWNQSFFDPGTVIFNNFADLVVGQFVDAKVRPAAGATVTFSGTPAEVGGGSVRILAGGGLTVAGPGPWNGFNMNLVNNGEVEIRGGAAVTFGFPALIGPPRAYITQAAGTLKLHAGSSLGVALNGFTQLSGGNFLIVGAAGVTDPARLVRGLRFSGGSIGFSGPYSRLKVEGGVTWEGGIFGPRLNAVNQAQSDTWEITGDLNLPAGHTAQIAPDPQNIPAGGINVNFRWESMLIGGTVPAGAAFPTVVAVDSRPQMDIYAATEMDVRHWRLGKRP